MILRLTRFSMYFLPEARLLTRRIPELHPPFSPDLRALMVLNSEREREDMFGCVVGGWGESGVEKEVQ